MRNFRPHAGQTAAASASHSTNNLSAASFSTTCYLTQNIRKSFAVRKKIKNFIAQNRRPQKSMYENRAFTLPSIPQFPGIVDDKHFYLSNHPVFCRGSAKAGHSCPMTGSAFLTRQLIFGSRFKSAKIRPTMMAASERSRLDRGSNTKPFFGSFASTGAPTI